MKTQKKPLKPTKQDYLKAMKTVEKHGLNRYQLGTHNGPKCLMGHIMNARWPKEFKNRFAQFRGRLPDWILVSQAMGFNDYPIDHFNDFGTDGEMITKDEALIFLGFGAAGAFK